MAKYEVQHSCGHSQTHQLFGPGKSRESKLSWLEGTLCSDCYHQHQSTQRTAGNVAAAELNAATGLPVLTGSEKQIAWAESIRQPVCEALAAAEKLAIEKLDPEFTDAAREQLGDALALVTSEISRETGASTWIDRRSDFEDFQKPDRAAQKLLLSIRERGLAPLVFEELATIEVATAKRRGDLLALAAQLVDKIEDSAITWDRVAGTVTAIVDSHSLSTITKYYGTESIKLDGEPLEQRSTDSIEFGVVTRKIGNRLRGFASRTKEAEDVARIAKAKADYLLSLESAKVVSVRRTKERDCNTYVALDCGTELTGKHSVKDRTWSLNGKYGQTSDNNSDISRLAAEALSMHLAEKAVPNG